MSTLVEQTKARKDYHAKWDAIAKEEVQRVEDEDALDKQASSLSLGTDSGPKSEAEAQDKATNKALREAKALWEKRRDEEKKQKLIITGETKTVVVDPKLLGDALVVDIQECKKAVVTLIPGLKVAKVFVSQCEDVVVEVRCPLITSFVEVSRCTKTTLITSKILHTVQCDLCDDCSIIWATIECFNEAQDPGSRVYSAACRRLGVAVGGRQDSLRVEVDNFDRSLCDKDTPIKEQQFVTQLVDGKLLTERIVQGTSKRLVGTTFEGAGAGGRLLINGRRGAGRRRGAREARGQPGVPEEGIWAGRGALHGRARAAGLRFWKTAGRGAREPVGVLPEAGRPRPRAGGRGGGGRLRRYVCEGPLPARPGAARAGEVSRGAARAREGPRPRAEERAGRGRDTVRGDAPEPAGVTNYYCVVTCTYV